MASTLHINDHCLLLQIQDKQIESKAYAWFTAGRVEFDTPEQASASENCRLHPQQVNSRYWQQCDDSSIEENTLGLKRTADLVWEHARFLQQRYAIKELILVLPSHYQLQQIQLLLGIFETLGIRILSVVNKAVLQIAQQKKSSGTYLHLDLQLHQVVFSQVKVDAGLAHLGEVEVQATMGIERAYDALMQSIQKTFIDKNRFDPLHHAETEQQLFTALPEILSQLEKEKSTNISLQFAGTTHVVLYDVKAMENALLALTSALHNDASSFIDADIHASLNGASPLLLGGMQAQYCDTISAEKLQTMLMSNDVFVGDDGAPLVYCTQLACDTQLEEPKMRSISMEAEAVKAESASVKSTQNQVTHIVQNGRAYPIEHSQIEFNAGAMSVQISNHGNIGDLLRQNRIFIVGNESKSHIDVNDRIASHLADGVMQAISVVSTD